MYTHAHIHTHTHTQTKAHVHRLVFKAHTHTHTHTHRHLLALDYRNIGISTHTPTQGRVLGSHPVRGGDRSGGVGELIDAHPDEPRQTRLHTPDPSTACWPAFPPLRSALAVLRLKAPPMPRYCRDSPHLPGLRGPLGLLAPWRHKPRLPRGLSANPGAWHGQRPPNGSRPRAVDDYDTLPPRGNSTRAGI